MADPMTLPERLRAILSEVSTVVPWRKTIGEAAALIEALEAKAQALWNERIQILHDAGVDELALIKRAEKAEAELARLKAALETITALQCEKLEKLKELGGREGHNVAIDACIAAIRGKP